VSERYPDLVEKPKIRAVQTTEAGQSIHMTNDRILVRKPSDAERSTKTGLVIPATAASVNKRCIWSEVVAVGPNVRAVEAGDHVLHLPEGGLEVEIRGEEFILLRERDVHAVASDRTDAGTGLYL
jgi:chaperonin GroES